ncbi:MAG: hypothetical protein C0502_10635 [Opitutus sp.]|nr:hypothetical protein [Opitutus sp.]
MNKGSAGEDHAPPDPRRAAGIRPQPVRHRGKARSAERAFSFARLRERIRAFDNPAGGSQPPRVRLSPLHLRYARFAACVAAGAAVAVAAPVRIGIEDYEPYSFRAPSGKLSGYAVELIEAIGRQQSMEVELVYKPWDELLDDIRAGRIDVLANVGYTEARTQFLDYSVHHTRLLQGVVVRKELKDVADIEELRGRRFAAAKDSLPYDWIVNHGFGRGVVVTADPRETLAAVNEGRADALIMSRPVASKYIREGAMANVVITGLAVPGLDSSYHFAVRRGDAALLLRLNEGLAALRASGDYDRLYEQWLGPLQARPLRFKDVRPYLPPFAVVVVIVVVALYRQRRLLRQLARQAAALRESEDRYRRFFNDDLAGAFISSPGGRILACNPSFAATFGFAGVEQAVGSDLVALHLNATAHDDWLAQLRPSQPIRDRQIEMRRTDGRPVFVAAHVIGSFDPQGALLEIKGYVIDTTERRRLEEQLRQSQKMEAIGQLAGGVAHDFNNILTVIMGHSSMALFNERLDGQTRAALTEIRNAGQRASSLTRQLLAFSRKQIIRPVPCNLNAVVTEMEKMLRSLIGEDIRLELELAPDIGTVRADPGQIEQILLNLAVNARDAMPNGGSIRIRTANDELAPDYAARFEGASPGPCVHLAVTDTGCGMDAETQARIFDPFFTTKGVGQGTGLGLSSVYGIVKQNRGHITVTSAPGAGTTLSVYLPRIGEAPQSPAPSSAAPPARGSGSILLVEDNDIVRETVLLTLRAHGYHVSVAASGPEALRLAESRAQPFDLVLTDIVMPEMNGRELAERLRRLRPECRIMFMSGHTDDAIFRCDTMNSGVPFLQKPFTPVALLEKVSRVIAGRR